VPKEHAKLEIYDLDSHRLAFFLDRDDKLVPLIQRALTKARDCLPDMYFWQLCRVSRILLSGGVWGGLGRQAGAPHTAAPPKGTRLYIWTATVETCVTGEVSR